MSRRNRRIESILLAVSLAVVAAFGVSLFASRDTKEVRGSADPAPDPGRIRVEVLNGAGTAGLAWKATDLLRERGFDVVYYGNASSFGRDSSVVLARSGPPEAAAAVARALGIEGVTPRPDSSLYLEVTVVLGKDWPSTGPDPDSAGAAERLERIVERLTGGPAAQTDSTPR